METRTAEEIMVPIDNYPHVPETMSIAEAIQVIRGCQIVNPDGQISSPRVLLVIHTDAQFVGIVRRRDILRGLEPGYLISGKVKHQRSAFGLKADPDLSELSYDKLADGLRSRSQKPVKEIMRPIVATINHDDHVMKAINELVEYDTSILPVVKHGKVVGVLRTIDVLHEIAALLHLAPENTA